MKDRFRSLRCAAWPTILAPYTLLAMGLLVVFATVGCSTPEEANSLASASSKPPLPSAGQVKSDVFKIVHSRNADTLTVSLDTDLPESTSVGVRVSRSYFEKNSTDEYARDYFEETSTVGRWRQPREITVSHDTFKASLQEKQRKEAQVGLAGEVERIDDEVVVSFIVPTNQFGQGNINLTGSAVTLQGTWHMVTAEARVPYPLDSKPTGPQWANRNNLLVGRTYQLSRETPLMAELNPDGFDAQLKVIASRKAVPAGGSITINEISMKDGDRWYRVAARGDRRDIGEGWVNSNAFIGQQLQIVESGR